MNRNIYLNLVLMIIFVVFLIFSLVFDFFFFIPLICVLPLSCRTSKRREIKFKQINEDQLPQKDLGVRYCNSCRGRISEPTISKFCNHCGANLDII